MKEQSNPFVEQMVREMEKLFKQFSDMEHVLVQKDIEIATLEYELGLQKRFYALLRESYLKLTRSRHE